MISAALPCSEFPAMETAVKTFTSSGEMGDREAAQGEERVGVE
jgi:hypothetical protein